MCCTAAASDMQVAWWPCSDMQQVDELPLSITTENGPTDQLTYIVTYHSISLVWTGFLIDAVRPSGLPMHYLWPTAFV